MTVPLAFDQPTRPLDDQLPYFSVLIRKEERRNHHSALLCSEAIDCNRRQRSMVSTAPTTVSAPNPAPKSASTSGNIPMEQIYTIHKIQTSTFYIPASSHSKESKKFSPQMMTDLMEKLTQVSEKLDKLDNTIQHLRPMKHKLGAHPEAPPTKREVICVFCSGNHQATHCMDYATSDARWARTGVLSICKHCGRRGHQPESCYKRGRKCNQCGDNHLSAYCMVLVGPNQ
ncbi:hypothetical protein CRE_21786 [Caenorhabditis remanei]|uniref:CCHC-type domain-containing protein n=1 Tax=Caenorhabditis remanei TaxID=31234 RepID=E3MEG3_CAERE|nr:hypothetical protein CRE_21786 [Caenorhabditis remanei]